MEADELLMQRQRLLEAGRRPRLLFSRSLSDSGGSDWGSSSDEFLSNYLSSILQPEIQKGNVVATNSGSFGRLNPKKADVNVVKTSFKRIAGNCATSGALMESQRDEKFLKRNASELGYIESTPDPQDDRYLFCYEYNKFYLEPCSTHPIMWIRSAALLGCDAVKSGKINDCSCGKDEINHAKRSAPEPSMHVGRSSIRGAGLGAWAEMEIPIGSVLWPYVGEIAPLEGLSDKELKMNIKPGYELLTYYGDKVRGNSFTFPTISMLISEN
ncbi:unnamed protein product [Taenia asiatica]|uniref:SET domain-containing protein n=1 Tax=Taenia asiatica TaxID=60517 RepID=A0A0R3W264_TAEAS|nr:unnamed protein product [Taenia asiatica]